MKLVFATGNAGKLREAAEILGSEIELMTPLQLGVTEDIPEDGDTLQANSIQKAQYLYQKFGCDCFADDTGLEVDALHGAPGVYTARYAGEDKDFDNNMDKVIAELAAVEAEASMARSMGLSVPKVSRKARFKCVVTLILNGEIHLFDGNLEGVIAREKTGDGGFGYDPVFIAEDFPGKSLSEVSESEKNAVSHRGKSLRAMATFLREKSASKKSSETSSKTATE